MKGPDYWFIRLSSYRDVTLDHNAANWTNQIRTLSQEPGIPTTERTVVPSRPDTNSHLSRVAVLADTNGNGRVQGRGCGRLQLGTQCSMAGAQVSVSTYFLGTPCSLISFNTFPFCLCLPELVSNLQGRTNPTLQLKIINQIALLFCALLFSLLETVWKWIKRACNTASCKEHILITKTRELSVQKDSCNKLEMISEILRNSWIQQEKSQESKFKWRSLSIFLSHCFSDSDPPGTEDGKEIWCSGYDLLEMRYTHLENLQPKKKKKKGEH